MTELRRFGLLDLLLFVVVLAAAGAARGWYLWEGADQAQQEPLRVQDAHPAERDALVNSLKEDKGFQSQAPLALKEEATAHTAPGYPFLLYSLQQLPLNYERADMDRLVRWIQCGLGTLTAGFYFLFARRAFRNLFVATLAGLLCAANPFWIVNTAELNDGVLATFLLAAALPLGARGGQMGGAFTSLLYGVLLAALALVRAALLPFAFVAMLWYLLRARWVRLGWLYALVAFLGFITGLMPWAFRNLKTYEDAVPVVDSTYLHLYMGNNAKATGGPQSDQALLAALAEQRGQDPQAVADDLGKLSQKERYASLGQAVVDTVRDDPIGTLERRLWAGLFFFFGEEWFKDRRLAEEISSSSAALPSWLKDPKGVMLGSLFGMLLLGVLGWRWTYAWAWEAMPSSLAVFWIPLPYLLGHAETLSGPRLPLDGVLLTYGAFAVGYLLAPLTGLLRVPPRDREGVPFLG
jgi:hypothetical protein